MKAKVLSIALAAILATTATTVFANDGGADNPIELKYINTKAQLPIYQLRLNNLSKGSYAIAIKDETGSLLYNETVAGAKIVRNYQFDAELPADTQLTFEVSNLKDNTVKVYNVSKNTKVVEDVVVNEVK
ncbi:hypothetical protein A8C56_02175 [Niabella ginsenosidivorans]|uniref:Uncharacterized protein n=1 Tax=Niabella ginsenosidivorans TaxID=1176587 RepID=A0A1A9IAA2_9BACT|nr:hypothetical protein A8C56_02175 [Niabella ginsenosidivorans]